ncbi:MAG: S8 family serine peptidase [Syntrophomonas sp.]|nr:S8 family serine peptidase [Syntrophomonas sp.]
MLANDRSADIIGSRPLLAENVVTSTGLSGKGQIVGLADNGLDIGSMTDIHPDLSGRSGNIPKVMLQSYTNRAIPDDPSGHGTFMAAAIAGTGAASEGKYRGIAPGASIYFQALLDKNDEIKTPAQIADLFLPAYQAGVRVHVNGWGNGVNTYDSKAVQIDKFSYLHPEFLPVFGAGNSGPGHGTITSQANSKNALVIGSSQVPRPAFDTEARFADQVTPSSSRGPAGDGRIKPDLLAPGSAIVSACSRLTDSNYAPDPNYTRMGGTSMAAAVTGGALALLREQLGTQYGISYPSSALLKALLVNGARPRTGDPELEGFGFLDLGATSLALKEGAWQLVDDKMGLKQGEYRQYKIQVDNPGSPLRITLAWTDPAGTINSPFALVNDLDLYVTDSSGNHYYGNDFDNRGMADVINNVERVNINLPGRGEYTIAVRAKSILAGNNQDFALVYGPSLRTSIIEKAHGSQLELADGDIWDITGVTVKQVNDGQLIESSSPVLEGSEIYYRPGKAYIIGGSWHTGGIQALDTAEGALLLEMNQNVREGGYYLDPTAARSSGSIMVNGQAIAGMADFPLGAELNATINPVLQTLWKLEAHEQKIEGFIESVDTVNRELRLLGTNRVYRLSQWASISYQDRIVDAAVQDAPYTTVDRSIFENLLPGMEVTMKVSPGTGAVQSLFVERPLVMGKVTRIDAANRQVVLDTGRAYDLFPGSIVYRNQDQVSLEDIEVGDQVKAQLMINSSAIIQIRAYSDVSYGRVVYTNTKKRSLYVIDSQNRSRAYAVTDGTDVFGMGITMEPSAIMSGNWVRIMGDPNSQEAWRIDIADIGQESSKTLQSIDYARNLLSMADGTQYQYNRATRISKGGYIMGIGDLLPGDRMQLTTLMAPSPWSQILAGIEVQVPADVDPPRIRLTAQRLEGVLVIQGDTTADRLYLYRNDGSRETIDATGGSFNRGFNLLDKEDEITAVALDMDSGAMKDITVKLSDYPIGSPIPIFNDVEGHWALEFIIRLAGRNVLRGYEDGSFRPERQINRAELMVLIGQLYQPSSGDSKGADYFSDNEDIPWWARPQVQAARASGWINGYPDGSFRPYEAVTRRQLAQVFSNLQKTPLTSLFPGESLQPDRPVTRAEVAAILARLSTGE